MRTVLAGAATLAALATGSAAVDATAAAAVQPRPPAETSKGYRNRFITYTIDVKSHRLTSYYIQQPTKRPERTWLNAILQVTALTAAPRLPVAGPVC